MKLILLTLIYAHFYYYCLTRYNKDIESALDNLTVQKYLFTIASVPFFFFVSFFKFCFGLVFCWQAIFLHLVLSAC